MDDRPLPRRLLTGCQDGLEETRFGGFFVVFKKVPVDSGAPKISSADCSQSGL